MRAKRASQRSCYTHLTRPDDRTVARTRAGTVSCDQDQDQDRDSSDQTGTRTGTVQTGNRTRLQQTGPGILLYTVRQKAGLFYGIRHSHSRQQTATRPETWNLGPKTENDRGAGQKKQLSVSGLCRIYVVVTQSLHISDKKN